jgi:hypothetical protein
MAKKRRMLEVTPTLSEIRLVMNAQPRREIANRRAVIEAQAPFLLLKQSFRSRATLENWRATVSAARRLHREIKAAERTSRTGIFAEPDHPAGKAGA